HKPCMLIVPNDLILLNANYVFSIDGRQQNYLVRYSFAHSNLIQSTSQELRTLSPLSIWRGQVTLNIRSDDRVR
ncbi:MAG TPA: hypothetical protein VFD24_09140, partial [Chitinophagaceae bacterium]|nr:hypothetical protein [Chitinophagaceae bacterium]